MIASSSTPGWRETFLREQTLGGVACAILIAALASIPPMEISAAVAAVTVATIAIIARPMVGAAILLAIVPYSGAFKLPLGDLDLAVTEPLFALFVLSWGLRASVRHEVTLVPGRIVAPVAALLLAIALSALASEKLTLTAKEAIKWLEVLTLTTYIGVHARASGSALALLAVAFLAASGEALYGMYQFVTGTGPAFFAIGPFMRAHGHFGQPNPFGGYLASLLPLTIVAAVAAPRRPVRIIAMAAAALAGAAIVMSFSRGAWLGLILAGIAMLLIWRPDTARILAGLAAGAMSLAVLGSLGMLPPVLADRLGPVIEYFGVFDVRGVRPTPENFALIERLAHWQAGLEMFASHPLLGVGAGNYSVAYPNYALPGWPESLGHAHNFYINTAAEAGLLGLAALVWVLVALVRRLRATIATQTAWPRALALGLLGSTVVFSVHSMFDNLLVSSMAIQIGTVIGLSAMLDRESGWGTR